MYVQYDTTAVIIVFFTELFEIKCKRGSRNKFLAVSFFENRLYTSIYVKNNPDKSLGKLSLLKWLFLLSYVRSVLTGKK